MTYLAAWNVRGRLVAVVGGGAVGARKARTLLAAGAHLRLVSPKAVAPLRRAAREGRVEWRRRAFRSADLAGAVLAFAATDDPRTNRRVAAEARRRKIPVNVADSSAPSDFHVPATQRRGPIVVGVSTGGADPALAAALARRAGRAIRSADVARARAAERRRRIERERRA